MDRRFAAEQFARMLARYGIDGAFQNTILSIEDPPNTNKNQWLTAKSWIELQPPPVRDTVYFLIRQALVYAVFSVAVHFDGAAGYEMIGDRPAELAVSFLLYDNIDDAMEGRVAESVQVCPKESGEEIHDILLDIVDRS